MIEERIDELIKVYEGYIDENNQSIKKRNNKCSSHKQCHLQIK